VQGVSDEVRHPPPVYVAFALRVDGTICAARVPRYAVVSFLLRLPAKKRYTWLFHAERDLLPISAMSRPMLPSARLPPARVQQQ